MEDLLAKIYQTIICNERDSTQLAEMYDEKLESVLEPLKESITEDEVEKLREIIYEVAYVVEQGGFMLGVRFMAKLIEEITAKDIQIIDN